jgi:hypothetical protein
MLYINTIRDANGIVLSAKVSADQSGESRWDWKDIREVEHIASLLGEGFIGTDAGPNVSPRYDVIALPKVGDKVSYAFNGDSYPCGTVKSISKSKSLIITTEGQKFYRRKASGCWKYNRTWSLQPGHVKKTNPSF